jgi:hypothetical protein
MHQAGEGKSVPFVCDEQFAMPFGRQAAPKNATVFA